MFITYFLIQSILYNINNYFAEKDLIIQIFYYDRTIHNTQRTGHTATRFHFVYYFRKHSRLRELKLISNSPYGLDVFLIRIFSQFPSQTGDNTLHCIIWSASEDVFPAIRFYRPGRYAVPHDRHLAKYLQAPSPTYKSSVHPTVQRKVYSAGFPQSVSLINMSLCLSHPISPFCHTRQLFYYLILLLNNIHVLMK